MKRIVVDRDRCEGNAVCMNLAPRVFRVDDKDQLHLATERPADDQLAAVELAVKRCPRAALALVEDEP
jgi:ferredoxin